jgi:hypothetical protein
MDGERPAIRDGFPQKVGASLMNSAGLTRKELSATLEPGDSDR